MNEFQEFLKSKKIDPLQFETRENDIFRNWEKEFMEMSAESFVAQKLYLINPMRRRFRIKEESTSESTKKVAKKPKIKPRIKP